MDKGKAIAEAYRTPSNEEETSMLEQTDPEIRRLEAILWQHRIVDVFFIIIIFLRK